MSDVPPIGKATPYRSDTVLFNPPAPPTSPAQDSFHVTSALRSGGKMDGKLRQEYCGQVRRAKLERLAAIEKADEDAALARIREKAAGVKIPEKFRQPGWYEDKVLIPNGTRPPTMIPLTVTRDEYNERLANVRAAQVKAFNVERARARVAFGRMVVPPPVCTLAQVMATACVVLDVHPNLIPAVTRGRATMAREAICYLGKLLADASVESMAALTGRSCEAVIVMIHRGVTRRDELVSQHHPSWQGTRFWSMVYADVLAEVEAKINAKPIERGLDAKPDQDAGGGGPDAGNLACGRPCGGASGVSEAAGGVEGPGPESVTEPNRLPSRAAEVAARLRGAT